MADYPSYKSPLLIGRAQKKWVQVIGWIYPAVLWLLMGVIAFLVFNSQTLSYFEQGEKALKGMVTIPIIHPTPK